MATTAHITIPFPVLPVSPAASFTVVIKDDATGVVAYSGHQGNTEFDVSLNSGCYTMFTTYNSYTNQWCFCVTDCSCVPYVSAVITDPSIPGVRYVEVTFNLSGWTFCPFSIGVQSMVGDNSYAINSLSDLTLVSGTTYKFTAYVGASPNAVLNIYKGLALSSGTCVTQYLAYSCTPALMVDPLHPTSYFIQFIKISGQWYIRMKFWNCGSSCHFFTVNYLQNYPGTDGSDTGSATITLNCSNPSPWQTDIPINPRATFYAGQGTLPVSSLNYLAYFLTITDCCGNPITYITGIHNYPIPAFGPG